MKTAITSAGDTLDSTLDPRFGRCQFFIILDGHIGDIQILPNPYKDAMEGAGPAAVKLLAERQVSKIISGEFGLKIKGLLDSLQIQMIILKGPGITVREILELLKNREA